jgi:hypothetical protein
METYAGNSVGVGGGKVMFDEFQLEQIQRAIENNLDLTYILPQTGQVMMELIDLRVYLDIPFEVSLDVCGDNLFKLLLFGKLIDHGVEIDEIRQAFQGTLREIIKFVEYHTIIKFIP